jgi:sterol desaturase/sphingolipid hydroxylase (fatty acid hydroxylase superfamily)
MTFFGMSESQIIQQIIPLNIFYKLPLYQIILLARNYTLLSIINFGLKNKQNITENMEPLKEEYYGEFLMNFIRATFIEVLTLLFVQNFYFTFPISDFNLLYEFLWFIPLSFMFEIVFDFFHYWTHRIAHSNKLLYKYLHKKHHKFSHPTAIITYYQEPLDLIITNSIPVILTLCIIPKITYFQYSMILMYKTYIEISGHVGKKLYPTSSFTQFMWLPKLFNIELYAEDHDIHHSKNNCNYSKRFSLWDKVFGTYYSRII